MKIKTIPDVFTVEMSIEELTGLFKMVRSTSVSSRVADYHLSEKQSKALDDWYSQLYDYLRALGIPS